MYTLSTLHHRVLSVSESTTHHRRHPCPSGGGCQGELTPFVNKGRDRGGSDKRVPHLYHTYPRRGENLVLDGGIPINQCCWNVAVANLYFGVHMDGPNSRPFYLPPSHFELKVEAGKKILLQGTTRVTKGLKPSPARGDPTRAVMTVYVLQRSGVPYFFSIDYCSA